MNDEILVISISLLLNFLNDFIDFLLIPDCRLNKHDGDFFLSIITFGEFQHGFREFPIVALSGLRDTFRGYNGTKIFQITSKPHLLSSIRIDYNFDSRGSKSTQVLYSARDLIPDMIQSQRDLHHLYVTFNADY